MAGSFVTVTVERKPSPWILARVFGRVSGPAPAGSSARVFGRVSKSSADRARPRAWALAGPGEDGR
jgi:hypothetical protein